MPALHLLHYTQTHEMVSHFELQIASHIARTPQLTPENAGFNAGTTLAVV